MRVPSLLSRPFWLAHLVVVVAVAVSIAMSMWQFDVWRASRHAQQHDVSGLAPVELSRVMKQGEAFPGNAIGRQVTLSGRWIPADTFFVPSGHGYAVVTPIRVSDGAISVVRGWSPRLTAPAVAATPVSIHGWLEPSDESNPVEIAPRVFGSLSLAAVVQKMTIPLYAAYVVTKTATNGVQNLTVLGPTETGQTEVSWGTGLRNFLYGVQWLFFVVLSIYLWWKWCRDRQADLVGEQVTSGTS